jgi:hypothetical protein
MCPARLCPFYRFVGAPREARDPRHAVGVETVTLQSRDDLALAGCKMGGAAKAMYGLLQNNILQSYM